MINKASSFSLRFHQLKYLAVLAVPTFALMSFFGHGILAWTMPIMVFGILNLLDFILPASDYNLSETEEQKVKRQKIFDILVWAMVPVQWLLLIVFCIQITETGLSGWEIAGRIVSMGICCGVLGINVAHELGHRNRPFEKRMAKALLLTSLYTHFFIEHNRGHHRNVATEADPASARYGEVVYTFWIRSVVMSWLSAWKLENKRLRKKKLSVVSLKNEMIRFTLLQFGLLLAMTLIFSWQVLLAFLAAATIGFLLLETVNYLEHYGLTRKMGEYGRFEKVLPVHSWNSSHPIGRVMLFELTRHSDHHYHAGRKYQVLRHFETAPQLPAGYPAMILVALLPPLWFWIMHREINNLKAKHPDGKALA